MAFEERKQTICWWCEKNCFGCSWAKEFKPVEGWKAERTKRMEQNGRYMESYRVIECPEFVLTDHLRVNGVLDKLCWMAYHEQELKFSMFDSLKGAPPFVLSKVKEAVKEWQGR